MSYTASGVVSGLKLGGVSVSGGEVRNAFHVNVSARTNYTVFLLSAGNQRNQIQTLLIQDR